MFETALLAGGLFGAKHAFEADHIAAVATLVGETPRPAATGAAWGLGHSVPIFLVGGLFVALDLQLPATVGTVFEAVVAAMLIGLGIRVLVGGPPIGISLLRHSHARDSTETGHRHFQIGTNRIGLSHTHTDTTSFAVGIIHGLAGSGGVVVALAAAAPATVDGAGFLIGFSAASISAMAAASWGCDRGIARVSRLREVAGVASIVVGVVLCAELVGTVLPV